MPAALTLEQYFTGPDGSRRDLMYFTDLTDEIRSNAETPALQEMGLWMEDPRWCPTWLHVQCVPPASDRRVYIPSANPPLAGLLPGQQAA
jgi:hypothetical protein